MSVYKPRVLLVAVKANALLPDDDSIGGYVVRDRPAIALHAAQTYCEAEGHDVMVGLQAFSPEEFAVIAEAVERAQALRSARLDALDAAAAKARRKKEPVTV